MPLSHDTGHNQQSNKQTPPHYTFIALAVWKLCILDSKSLWKEIQRQSVQNLLHNHILHPKLLNFKVSCTSLYTLLPLPLVVVSWSIGSCKQVTLLSLLDSVSAATYQQLCEFDHTPWNIEITNPSFVTSLVDWSALSGILQLHPKYIYFWTLV